MNQMKIKYFNAALLCVICLLSSIEILAQNPASKPNIILIMADDIRYEAFGSYSNTNNIAQHEKTL